MRALLGITCLVTLAVCMLRAPLEHNQYLPHQHDQWRFVRDADASEPVTLVLALKQQNLEVLEDIFWRVSDPRSRDYGKFMTLEEIEALIRPSTETFKTVLNWLQDFGVTTCITIKSRDFLKCHMSVGVAQHLLDTTFSYFRHATSDGHVILRSRQTYSVPYFVKEHLDFVGGLHRVPNVASGIKFKDNSLGDFRYGVHPDVLRKRYNVSDHVGSAEFNNSQGTAQFLNQHYSASDLKEFMHFFGKGFQHLDEISKEVGPNKGKIGLEANLDVQYIMSLGANIPTTFWSTGGLHDKQEPFLEWLLDLSNTTELPLIFSVSYGDHERTLSEEYMRRVNVEFQKLGLRGVSVLFASGDDGAGCHYFNDTAYTFEPDFPASSPYVTTVGGTEFVGYFTDRDEKGNDISGGGFSNIFKMPKYQQETVAKYLNTTALPDSKYFNRNMRAYPDVSAMSDDFWIIIDRVLMNVAGTSAATPTVAGMIGLVNGERLKRGKPQLGFLNPFIYQNPDVWYDIVLGDPSQACWLDDLEGYKIAEGWDPVTGFGSPNYPDLLAAGLKV